MYVNTGKTKIVHFRKKSVLRTEFEFYLGNSKLEICQNYKYLDVVYIDFVDFTETSNVLSEAAGRAFSSLVSNLYNKVDVMYSTYTKLYDTKIVPIMDYASSIWGYKLYSKADTFHNRVIRFFLGVHKCTSNPAIQGDMGWTPPQIRRQLNSLRLWKRLITMDNNRLTKRIFLWDL